MSLPTERGPRFIDSFFNFFSLQFFLVRSAREPPRDGAYIAGIYLEGAKWDTVINSLASSTLKELYYEMPVIHIKATTKDKQELRNVYECPIYKTR